MLFLKTYFTKVSYVCGISLKKHILVDLEQFENEIQIPPRPMPPLIISKKALCKGTPCQKCPK